MDRAALETQRRALQASTRERRHYPRAPHCGWVRVRSGLLQNTYLFTKDISGGGIFIISDVLPELGSEVEIELTIREQARLATRGRVVRVVQPGTPSPRHPRQNELPGFALAFQSLAPEHAAELMELVEEALARSR